MCKAPRQSLADESVAGVKVREQFATAVSPVKKLGGGLDRRLTDYDRLRNTRRFKN
jgi:hypothetical protein